MDAVEGFLKKRPHSELSMYYPLLSNIFTTSICQKRFRLYPRKSRSTGNMAEVMGFYDSNLSGELKDDPLNPPLKKRKLENGEPDVDLVCHEDNAFNSDDEDNEDNSEGLEIDEDTNSEDNMETTAASTNTPTSTNSNHSSHSIQIPIQQLQPQIQSLSLQTDSLNHFQ